MERLLSARAVRCRSSVQSDESGRKPTTLTWLKEKAEHSVYTSIFKGLGNKKGKGRKLG